MTFVEIPITAVTHIKKMGFGADLVGCNVIIEYRTYLTLRRILVKKSRLILTGKT
jgi:hypothetical protein